MPSNDQRMNVCLCNNNVVVGIADTTEVSKDSNNVLSDNRQGME